MLRSWLGQVGPQEPWAAAACYKEWWMNGVGHLAIFPPVTVTLRNIYCVPLFLGHSEPRNKEIHCRSKRQGKKTPASRGQVEMLWETGPGLQAVLSPLPYYSLLLLHLPFETIGNKEKNGGLLSSFTPASPPPQSRDGPRHPPAPSPEPVLTAKFSKGACSS